MCWTVSVPRSIHRWLLGRKHATAQNADRRLTNVPLCNQKLLSWLRESSCLALKRPLELSLVSDHRVLLGQVLRCLPELLAWFPGTHLEAKDFRWCRGPSRMFLIVLTPSRCQNPVLFAPEENCCHGDRVI